MYRYLSLRSDSEYSKVVTAVEVGVLLSEYPELKRRAHLNYENKGEFPWIQIIAVFSDKNGNYAVDDANPFKNVNQIEMICASDGSDAGDMVYIKLAKKIAAHFDWEIYDSELECCI